MIRYRTSFLLSLFLLLLQTPLGGVNGPRKTKLLPGQALQKLLDGNKRYMEGVTIHPHQGAEQRAALAHAQRPTAVILTCSDSRIVPAIIFDQGLGDLFEVRVAGNIPSKEILGSIEYAVEFLEVPLLIVLGHERCGAVIATVDSLLKGTSQNFSPHLNSIVDAILPAAKAVQKRSGDEHLLDNTIRENVRHVVQVLQQDPILAKAVVQGRLEIVGACYDLVAGNVELVK